MLYSRRYFAKELLASCLLSACSGSVIYDTGSFGDNNEVPLVAVTHSEVTMSEGGINGENGSIPGGAGEGRNRGMTFEFRSDKTILTRAEIAENKSAKQKALDILFEPEVALNGYEKNNIEEEVRVTLVVNVPKEGASTTSVGSIEAPITLRLDLSSGKTKLSRSFRSAAGDNAVFTRTEAGEDLMTAGLISADTSRTTIYIRAKRPHLGEKNRQDRFKDDYAWVGTIKDEKGKVLGTLNGFETLN